MASNTATANVLLPILADMSLTICQNPIYLVRSVISCVERAQGQAKRHELKISHQKFEVETLFE